MSNVKFGLVTKLDFSCNRPKPLEVDDHWAATTKVMTLLEGAKVKNISGFRGSDGDIYLVMDDSPNSTDGQQYKEAITEAKSSPEVWAVLDRFAAMAQKTWQVFIERPTPLQESDYQAYVRKFGISVEAYQAYIQNYRVRVEENGQAVL